jgi:hypothetical protein
LVSPDCPLGGGPTDWLFVCTSQLSST